MVNFHYFGVGEDPWPIAFHSRFHGLLLQGIDPTTGPTRSIASVVLLTLALMRTTGSLHSGADCTSFRRMICTRPHVPPNRRVLGKGLLQTSTQRQGKLWIAWGAIWNKQAAIISRTWNYVRCGHCHVFGKILDNCTGSQIYMEWLEDLMFVHVWNKPEDSLELQQN